MSDELITSAEQLDDLPGDHSGAAPGDDYLDTKQEPASATITSADDLDDLPGDQPTGGLSEEDEYDVRDPSTIDNSDGSNEDGGQDKPDAPSGPNSFSSSDITPELRTLAGTFGFTSEDVAVMGSRTALERAIAKVAALSQSQSRQREQPPEPELPPAEEELPALDESIVEPSIVSAFNALVERTKKAEQRAMEAAGVVGSWQQRIATQQEEAYYSQLENAINESADVYGDVLGTASMPDLLRSGNTIAAENRRQVDLRARTILRSAAEAGDKITLNQAITLAMQSCFGDRTEKQALKRIELKTRNVRSGYTIPPTNRKSPPESVNPDKAAVEDIRRYNAKIR